ncbi:MULTISPECIES: OmpW family outer membrane protein [unclassified Caballeronia]|uniref:OmpW/AlkL family protein n=1 Tax=unclassified Caballeronia TaxID=2646786 RepID=UPI002027DB13
MLTVGGVGINFSQSSSDGLRSTSPYGTFDSSGTNAEIHNAFSAEVSLAQFITDNFVVETAFGLPPRLNVYAQGDARPIGANGPALALGELQPLLSVRAWPVTLLFKYYFRGAESSLRPFVGLGVNYTWYSNIHLNGSFYQAAQSFAGPGGTVRVSLSPSWNAVFSLGASYQLAKHWYGSASLTYFPLKSNATVSSVSATGSTILDNKMRINANPIVVAVGVGYAF